MGTADLCIQPARPEHATSAALLLTSTDTALFSFCGEGSIEPWRTLAEAEFRAPHGIYSYRFSRVIEQNSHLLGLVIGFTAAARESLDWSFANSKVAMELHQWQRVVGTYTSIESSLFPPIPADAFDLQNIVVAPESRNQGIGLLLLHAAIHEARESGASRVSLDVSATNPAVAFYERAGFVTTTVSPAPHPELEAHFRMELRLS